MIKRSGERQSKRHSTNDRMLIRDLDNMKTTKNSEFDSHKRNLDRLFMERDFSRDSKEDTPGNKFGEITGNEYSDHELERGLPMRSHFTIKKQLYDANEHLDFDLFDNRPSKLDVKYHDPHGSGNIDFADISTSMSKISTQINPIAICSDGIDKINNNLFYYLFDLILGNTYTINGIGIYNLFSALYLSSDELTEIELKKIFDFPKKDILYQGLQKINSNIEKINNMVNIKNFMIIGNDVPYDPHYYDSIRDFCVLIRTNVDFPENEANKLNKLIKRVIGADIRNPICAENINGLQLMFLATAIIHPIWATPFNKVIEGLFYGVTENKKTYFLHSIEKPYGYFEDNDYQILEIKCAGNGLVMGILLNKRKFMADVDDRKLHFYISHMKEMILEEVKIPVFKQELKLRFVNSLKNMGLNGVFIKIMAKDFFPEGLVLQDVVQNVKIIIDDSHTGSNQPSTKGCKNQRRFIANKPFIYYFRMPKTDTFLFMGSYQ